MLRKISILGVDITSASKDEILEYIFQKLEKSKERFYIVTPNPEIIVKAHSNSEYKRILNNADLALADGIGVVLAGKILGTSIKERVSGIDLMELICEKSVKKPIRIGLLGGRNGVAERVSECLQAKYPGLKIVFAASEWPDNSIKYKVESSKYEGNKKQHTTSYILPATIDILFVAFGAPKQERWIAENLEKIPVRIAMGVGGSFDILSGDIRRAPYVIRRFGFEWLYRLIREPWRWRRQLALFEFICLILKQRFTPVNKYL